MESKLKNNSLLFSTFNLYHEKPQLNKHLCNYLTQEKDTHLMIMYIVKPVFQTTHF